ncbi:MULTISPECIES: NfeD family protein [unclassified Colwellia]|uniref:NfeD family protein n=1 Tax=unclassified Colwellia TaxID=196834 RepID=UPI0015F63606|nr:MULTISPECIES: NfeD family protein [unclassified Colwellia]MBA6223418.1 NfeD family protein [Colwellia sp. MB3u-45]MBA6267943.1 NfeD family protein [Colwellia sp. MB3u-43]MBA6287730.1 NfeD family protein [Colwellia sp. MB3u-4]MBA6293082.1 NfeD family protein [Colwellia sp. MB3u-8]MBA6306597.1 NfeD family protein [Colwellia sp. MB3u-70]
MEYILFFETWLALAILFACLEIFVPGGILLNLGIASLLVAVGVQQQILDTWVLTLTTWFILATFLLILVYFITERFFAGETIIENIYEEVDIYGKKVRVLEQIGPGTQAGRVEYQGTTWTALSDGSIIQAGSEAAIVCKENISLVVEPIK